MAKKTKKKPSKKTSCESSTEDAIEYFQKIQKQDIPLFNQYNKMLGIIPVSKGEFIEGETTNDNLYELKKFIPIELNPTTQNYIDKLLGNMTVNNDFYNNTVLNLSHFYIFCVHCMLVKAYKHGKRIELLGFLKKTAGYFEKHDVDLDKLQHYAFNNIERDAIKFLFHIIGIDKDSHVYASNKRIFDLRNGIAHFNEQVISSNRYEEILEDIVNNLKELSQKAYKLTKESLFAGISGYTKKRLLDDENYIAVFEEINQRHYITYYDYDMLASRLTSQKPKTNYYTLKYATEQLGIE